jgi:outer membrane protein assembly factor BamB
MPLARACFIGIAAMVVLAGAVAVAATDHPSASAAADLLFDVTLHSASYGGGAAGDLDGDGEREIAFGTYYRDERVLALQHDGRVLWELPSGGGPVDGSVAVVDLTGDGRPEVLWGNAQSTEFHVADAAGADLWSVTVGEVLDAPAAVADMNADGQLDVVLASCGRSGTASGLRVFDGRSGRRIWRAEAGGCYQSAPLLFDQDGDGRLDVIVSTWFDNKVRAFSGRDGRLRWETPIGDWTYHAGSFGDLSGDGVPDVALGDYDGLLWALNGRDGAVLWSVKLPEVVYVFGPTAMADVDGDGQLNVIVAANRLFVFDADGRQQRVVDLPGYATRGPVLTDYNGDGLADIVVAMDGPAVRVYEGKSLKLLKEVQLSPAGDMDHHPVIADLDGDGRMELFTVYGHGESDDMTKNWGRAVLIALGNRGPEWPTYSHDLHHSGNYHWPVGDAVNRPTPSPTPPPVSPSPTPTVATPTVAVSTPIPTVPSPTATPTVTATPDVPTPQPATVPVWLPWAER